MHPAQKKNRIAQDFFSCLIDVTHKKGEKVYVLGFFLVSYGIMMDELF